MPGEVYPWAGAGPVSAEAYAAYLAHQTDARMAEEWGLLDARGRYVPRLGDRFEDWFDVAPGQPVPRCGGCVVVESATTGGA